MNFEHSENIVRDLPGVSYVLAWKTILKTLTEVPATQRSQPSSITT